MRRKIIFLLVAVCFLIKPFKSDAQVQVQDSLMLVKLYKSTNGAAWVYNTNWLTAAPVNTWYGIKTNGINVTSIRLASNFLQGTIPATWEGLPLLDTLDLGNNVLTGTIPTSLTNLIWLTQLRLNNNYLYGQIPAGFTNTRLGEFDVSNNKLSGTVPPIGGSTLNRLALNNNHLTGVFPQATLNLFNIGSLGSLYLQHNYFTFNGTEAVAAKTIGTRFYAPQDTILPIYYNFDDFNHFSVAAGGNLSNNTYRWYKNGVLLQETTGDSIYYVSGIGKYWVQVTNSVAKDLVLQSDTFNLVLANNTQDSLALVDLYNSTNGPAWTNHTNWLTKAPLSSWFGVELNIDTRVKELNLTSNNLTGTIPASFGNLTNITRLFLGTNNLTDPLPQSLGNLTNVVFLYLRGNKFSGSLPSWLANLSSVGSLNLSNNQFSGGLPAFFGKLTNLQSLHLSYNNLSGNIPDSLGNLYDLFIDHNQFTGNIPSWLGKHTNMEMMDLSYNHFTDSIPSSFGNFKKLIYLWLNNNQLSGTIPGQLSELSTLKKLYLDSNNLTFAGLEKLVESYTFSPFVYAPQAPIHISHTGNKLTVSPGGNLSNDTLRWFKDGVLLTTNIGDTTLLVTTKGKYAVTVTNKIATNLTLYGDTINVTTIPVTLLNFTGSYAKTDVQLNWQTAQEINAGNYYVERSINGTDFTGIGSVQAVGNSSVKQSYSYIDANTADLNVQKLYYRLKITDKDGSFSYSKIISLQNDDINRPYILYPNPARTSATVQFTAATAAKYTIAVTAMDGKIIKQINIAATTGVNRAVLNVESLSRGTYIVTITGYKYKQTLTLVKE